MKGIEKIIQSLQQLSVREARQTLGPLISKVAGTKRRVVVTKHKQPIMGCVPIEDVVVLEKMDAMKLKEFAEKQRHSTEPAIATESIDSLLEGLPKAEEEGEEDIYRQAARLKEELIGKEEENKRLYKKIADLKILDKRSGKVSPTNKMGMPIMPTAIVVDKFKPKTFGGAATVFNSHLGQPINREELIASVKSNLLVLGLDQEVIAETDFTNTNKLASLLTGKDIT